MSRMMSFYVALYCRQDFLSTCLMKTNVTVEFEHLRL